MSKSKKDKTPKAKIPALLKVIRSIFPVAEKVLPILAYRYFIKIFFTPFHYPVPEKENEIADKAEKFSFQAAGKTIQAYRWGEGPIVVFVHGWAGRGTQFRKFIEHFTLKGFQVVTFDGPAHGRSEGKSTNLNEFKDTLNQLFKLLPEQPTAVVTHSFGGVAALYAIMNGLPVTRLINIASPTIGDEIINTFLRAVGGTEKTKNYFKRYMIKTYGKPFDEFSSLYFIKQLSRPLDLLLVHDEEDKEVIFRHTEELMKVYPSARLYRTKGMGHTRILKDDAVVETCLRFVAS